MIDIYNEVAYIKNVLQDGLSKKWRRDAKLLTRYYKMEGMKKQAAKEAIIKKCKENCGRFVYCDINKNRPEAEKLFEKAWADKNPLREISKIEITKEVLDWFLSLETDYIITDEEQEKLKKQRPKVSIKNNRPVNWKRTKFLFTLYIWSKIQETYLNKPYMHYLDNFSKRFKEDADLPASFNLFNEENLLFDLGFININYALGIDCLFVKNFDVFQIPVTDENRITIELYKEGRLKDENGRLITEEEGDLHRCGYWLEKQKMGSFVCKKCGRETAYYGKGKNEHKRKYCKECLKKESRDEIICVDCGEIVPITSLFDRKTCRCAKCQENKNRLSRSIYKKKIRESGKG